MKLAVLTITADRPAGIELCRKYVTRQTRQDFDWIVVDGGQQTIQKMVPEAIVIKAKKQKDRMTSFNVNMTLGLLFCIENLYDYVIFMEDDDWYAPNFLEVSVEKGRGKFAAGIIPTLYYNIEVQRYRWVQNTRWASLSHMICSREACTQMYLRTSSKPQSYALDKFICDTGKEQGKQILLYHVTSPLVVSMKGLPGIVGLGMGHRPTIKFLFDAKFEYLRFLIKEDSLPYEEIRAYFLKQGIRVQIQEKVSKAVAKTTTAFSVKRRGVFKKRKK